MFSVFKPSPAQIRILLDEQTKLSFTYAEIGATRNQSPAGYAVNHHRIKLGEGLPAYQKAMQALRRWEMFNLNWMQFCWPEAPIEPGTVVGVLAWQMGLWALTACRIVYVISEEEPVQRLGFAYGTLPGHVAQGEERFSVEHHPDGSVWYDLYSFSRPRHPLARLGAPMIRRVQKRFGRDSLQAMYGYVNR